MYHATQGQDNLESRENNYLGHILEQEKKSYTQVTV